jgi:hypothetical protein
MAHPKNPYILTDVYIARVGLPAGSVAVALFSKTQVRALRVTGKSYVEPLPWQRKTLMGEHQADANTLTPPCFIHRTIDHGSRAPRRTGRRVALTCW